MKLVVYDLLGRQAALLVDGYRQEGNHDVMFDGSNLASGIYIYRLEAKPFLAGQANDFTSSGKMVLMK